MPSRCLHYTFVITMRLDPLTTAGTYRTNTCRPPSLVNLLQLFEPCLDLCGGNAQRSGRTGSTAAIVVEVCVELHHGIVWWWRLRRCEQQPSAACRDRAPLESFLTNSCSCFVAVWCVTAASVGFLLPFLLVDNPPGPSATADIVQLPASHPCTQPPEVRAGALEKLDAITSDRYKQHISSMFHCLLDCFLFPLNLQI